MYTKKEVYIYGYIAGLIKAAGEAKHHDIISPTLFSEACRKPQLGFTKIFNLAMKNNLINNDLNNKISKLVDHLSDVDFDDEDPDYCIPLPQQGTWQIGYFRGFGGRPVGDILEKEETGICAMRKAAGFSQKKLAEALGCGQGHISRWEAGIVTPSVENLKKMAEVLGCSIDQLTSK